jgi:hypothetical protein
MVIQYLLNCPRAWFRQGTVRQTSFVKSHETGMGITLVQNGWKRWSQTGATLEEPGKPVTLLPYGGPPEASRVLTGGIKLPFEQVSDQDLKATFKLAMFTPAQGLKLLPEMFLIKILPLPTCDHYSLVLCPRSEVRLIFWPWCAGFML